MASLSREVDLKRSERMALWRERGREGEREGGKAGRRKINKGRRDGCKEGKKGKEGG